MFLPCDLARNFTLNRLDGFVYFYREDLTMTRRFKTGWLLLTLWITLLCTSFAMGACSQYCVQYTFFYNGAGGYGTFDKSGSTVQTASTALYTNFAGGGTLTNVCVSRQFQYGFWVNTFCTKNPQTATSAYIPPNCPNYIGVVSQFKCSS